MAGIPSYAQVWTGDWYVAWETMFPRAIKLFRDVRSGPNIDRLSLDPTRIHRKATRWRWSCRVASRHGCR
jgi:hypothetical protein